MVTMTPWDTHGFLMCVYLKELRMLSPIYDKEFHHSSFSYIELGLKIFHNAQHLRAIKISIIALCNVAPNHGLDVFLK